MRSRNRISLLFLSLFILLCGCDPRFGCVESNFELAADSRLPKWYVMPANYSRSDLTIKFFHYLKARKIITYGPDNKKLAEQIGTGYQHPITENEDNKAREDSKRTGKFIVTFPRYQIITVNGISEVFEHKDSIGPVAYLYVTDDPKLTAFIK